MTYVPQKKGTLLIPSGPGNHLFAIITDKCAQEQHLLVNVSTIRKGVWHDPTTIVKAGEHLFCKDDSSVEYRFAIIERADKLTRMVAKKFYHPHSDISDGLLQAFLDGVEDSDHTPQYVLDYFSKLP